jgi:hypothetical protein
MEEQIHGKRLKWLHAWVIMSHTITLRRKIVRIRAYRMNCGFAQIEG